MRQARTDFHKTIVETLQDYFSDQGTVAAVYLFGSVTGEHFSAQSDIDVAVLYRAKGLPTPGERLQEQTELSEIFQRPVDLIVLNEVSPILRYQVLKYGEPFLTRDLRAVNAFFVRTLNEYFDLKQIRRVVEQSLQDTRIL